MTDDDFLNEARLLGAMMLRLRPTQVGWNGYTAADRLRDFRAVFFGPRSTKEQRERVLFQIMAESDMRAPIRDPDKDIKLGKRELCLFILRCATELPKPEFDQTQMNQEMT